MKDEPHVAWLLGVLWGEKAAKLGHTDLVFQPPVCDEQLVKVNIIWIITHMQFSALNPLTAKPSIVELQYGLDPDETSSYSASHPDPSCLTIGQRFYQRLSVIFV